MPQQDNEGNVIAEQYGSHKHGCFSLRVEDNDEAFLEMTPRGVFLDDWR